MRIELITLWLIFVSPITYGEITANRIASSELYSPGVPIRIQINLTGDPGPITVIEEPPIEWEWKKISGGGNAIDQTIVWDLPSFSGSENVYYFVIPPLDAAAPVGFAGQAGGREISGMTALDPIPFRFETPLNLGPLINSVGWEFSASLSAYGTTLYYTSARQGGGEIWIAKRPSVNDPWGMPVRLGPPINSYASETDVHLSPDNLSLYIYSGRRGGISGYEVYYGSWDIWKSTRETLGDPWGLPINLGPTVNSASWDSSPYLTGDSLFLFFSSYRSGRWDIWQTSRASREMPWEEPVNLGEPVNSTSGQDNPVVTADGLTLFFSSRRDGGVGSNSTSDIWISTRNSLSDPWKEPVNLGLPVNSTSNESPACLSSDGSTLIISSDRPGGSGSFDLWQVAMMRNSQTAVQNWRHH